MSVVSDSGGGPKRHIQRLPIQSAHYCPECERAAAGLDSVVRMLHTIAEARSIEGERPDLYPHSKAVANELNAIISIAERVREGSSSE